MKFMIDGDSSGLQRDQVVELVSEAISERIRVDESRLMLTLINRERVFVDCSSENGVTIYKVINKGVEE